MKLLRYVGDRCSDASYQADLIANDVTVVDSGAIHGNVSVEFFRSGRRFQMRWSPMSRDLFDLSLLLYLADELQGRGDAWSRRFQVRFPVVDHMTWGAQSAELERTLRFLTGDNYVFEWLATRNLRGYGNHRIGPPRGFDVVSLFSGGLDSLIGAFRLLGEGLRVVLVGHFADGVTSSAQAELFGALRTRYGSAVELVQCSMARSRRANPQFLLPRKEEYSHRARSFLFLSIAVAVAQACGINRIVMAENGLIALNPPLGTSRVGSLSTRTAHPRFLRDYGILVNTLEAFNGTLANLFMYDSKSDILAGLATWQRPLVRRSVSCAHAATEVRWEGRAGVLHCGHCIPCIYRRLSLMKARLDRADDYCYDVFADLASLSPAKQQDMRFLTRFARRLVCASAVELRRIVISHGMFPADVGRDVGPYAVTDYGPWADMLKRWACDFIDQIQQRASAKTRSIL